jgi:amino acid adenylation domain-containing protein/thioester reductase-like protein
MPQNLQCLTIAQLFEAEAKLSPNAEAVIFEGSILSYQDLDQSANKLANYLNSKGVGAGSLVGIFLDRSINLIISILATLKAGAAYVPLDLAYPSERLQFILEDSGTPLIITHSHLLQSLPRSQAQVMCLDLEWPAIETFMADPSAQQATPDSLAYIIYTSGSTGKPKGVAMHHRPLVNLLLWQKQQFKNPAARTLQFTPTSFDVSFQEIFSTLSCGGTLVLIEDHIRRNSEALLNYLSETSIERLFLPFIALQNLAEAAMSFPHFSLSLREVITAGEQLKITRSIAALFDRLEDCTLANQYGPSESHVVTQHVLAGSPKDWPHLPPIGQAISNAEIYLLDPQSKRKDDVVHLAEAGQPGELAIGGVPLAKGYLNRPELTKARFIQNPFRDDPSAMLYRTGDLVRRSPDGDLEYIERLDDQVKIRGVRVEVGEIEARLSQHPKTMANALVVRSSEAGIKYLVAYVVPNKLDNLQDTHALELELRSFLTQTLPNCMVPAFFEFLTELPTTPSGKVDRRNLPEVKQNRPALQEEYVAPSDPIQEKLSQIWSSTLEFNQIGVNDNFFDLGGDSLKVIQLIHLARKEFGIELPIVTLFDSPTIQGLSQKIRSAIHSKKSETSDDISILELEKEAIPNFSDITAGQTVHYSRNPKKVLITGVTGFLGAFLLAELLEKTQAEVYCLVRANTQEDGKQQIEKNLKKYKLWKFEHAHRIHPVAGDLAKPGLGIQESTFNKLAKEVEAIYHNGASISLIHPYASLREANVRGTQELLKLAIKFRMVPFHFISTLDVFQTSDSFSSEPLTEASSLQSSHAIYFDGYTKSKWVSERMVWDAHKIGLPVCVYRPAMIFGHSQTGVCNTNDLMNRLIKGFIQLGAAPQLDMVVNIAPVDYFSQGLIYLSLQEESFGKGFNFINPKPVSMTQFIKTITECGYPIELLDESQWQKLLTRNINKADGIVSVLTSKEEENMPSYIERSSVNASQVCCQNVIDGLRKTNIRCPELTADFLQPYFDYYKESGFITTTNLNKKVSIVA